MPNYEVKVECTVIKLLTVEDCPSADEAKANPFDYSVDELEVDQVDWKVLSVKESK